MPLYKDYPEDVRAAIDYAYHRPILHVNIIGEDGILADVDAKSTYDGLAYYLRSRGIVPDATEESVRMAAGSYRSDEDQVAFTQRGAIFGELLFQCVAKVH